MSLSSQRKKSAVELSEVLDQLDLHNDVNLIAHLDDRQRLDLKALISKYRNLLKLIKRYSNVENIDNESDCSEEADASGDLSKGLN